MKRYLYLWHRWLGIVLCLFMALWFVSGLVMLFVGYPKLTPAERLAHLPALQLDDCCVSPQTALAATGRSEAPQRLRLSSVAGRPTYLINYADGAVAVDARSGERLQATDRARAQASARQFAGPVTVHYLDVIDEDAWTHSRALDTERPLHRVFIDDDDRRLLYISHSGEVVRDATARERAWNWLGAWLHWLYPLRDSPWWADLIIYLSLAGTLVALLGQVVGVLRWRFSRPYRSGSRSPYAEGVARWHHVIGLSFGGLLIAWIFSGLMSMRPWHLFDNPSTLQASAYAGGQLSGETLAMPVSEIVNLMQQAGLETHELEWRMLGGRAYVTGLDATGDSRILPLASPAQALRRLPAATLENAARAMWPQGQAQVDVLDEFDAYYYARAEQSMYGDQRRDLPVLRMRFDDPAATWIYLDPRSGALVQQLDERRRVGRWLFNLLHSWDWQPLLARPWLREPLMVVASVGGLIISVSGVVLGWRRLRRYARKIHSPLQGTTP